jgi:NAD(P)H-hydrate epimerase
VAVDIPSGVDGRTGAVPGVAVRAVATVTFGARKPGLVLHPGAGCAGRIRVADIGFPRDLVRSDLWLMEHRDAAALAPRRAASGHKRSSGVVLVVAGSRDMTGAPVLAASAAYRAGAGLVSVALPESARAAVQSTLIEATFEPLPETEDGGVSEAAWPQLEKRLADVDAVAVGPGLGRSAETLDVVRRIVAAAPAPVVLDADGLFAFAGQLPRLAERRAGLIVTPHAGEFGRLLGTSAEEATDDRIERARRAAADARCAVLLKGAPTLVAEPGGRVRINATGGSALSTAGTGDVLTGAVVALLARGLAPEDAGALGAYVHGLAGDLAALHTGEGTTASDVAAALPQALGRLSHPSSAVGP